MGKVLIFGTNLASYRAAANLARAGHKVVLLNRGEFIWDKFTQMQWQQPRDIINGYSKGFLKNVMMATGNIEVYHNSSLLSVDGQPGNFKVRFKTRLPTVDEFKCIGCDICLEKCNAKHMPRPLGPGIYFVENPEECLDVCPVKAIQIPKEEEKEITVDAVILAPEYEPEEISKYVGNVENVISFRDFAFMFRGKGVDKRFLKRKDGKYPHRLGFFIPGGFENFLGSSEEYVIVFREAIFMKEMDPELEVHIFVKELRLYGHNQMKLYDEAREKGINVHIIDNVSISEENGEVKFNDVALDLLVVMPGQKVPEDWKDIIKASGIEEENGFARTKPFSLETTRDGVFAIGEFVKPVSSTEAVYHGTAIVPEVEKYLKPPEKPRIPNFEFVRDDFNPRVGLFICGCAAKNLNIDVDVDYISTKDFLCVRGEEIIKEIKENNLNRVVFAACSPAVRGSMLEMLAMKAGIHPSYVELVQLREYVSRVGGDDRKANALVKAAIAKARKDYFVEVPVTAMKKGVAIIGGGLAGLLAARYINGRVGVYIITDEFDEPHDITGVKEGTLNMSEEELKEWYENLKREALQKSRHIKGKVESIEGTLGNFRIKVGDEVIEAGVIIIATGGEITEKGNHIAGRFEGNTLHSQIGSILAKRRDKKVTYEFMKSYSLLDLSPPEGERGEGEPIGYVKAREYNKEIASLLGLRIDEDGFFYFAQEPLHNVERMGIQFFLAEEPFGGVFVAGLAHRPMSIEEEMEEAGFAAQSAIFLMRDIESPAGKLVSTTNPRRCAGCGICVDTCFSGARFIDTEDKIAKVNPQLCLGCGACANVCPSGAAVLVAYRADHMFEMLKEVVK